MEEKIAKLLLSLGMAPCLKGFRACVCAIEMILKDPSVMDCRIAKQLYPDVAKRLGSTADKVGRAIRRAIDVMFNSQDYELIVGTLGFKTNIHKGKYTYTNSEFLSLCALKLKMDENGM